MTWTTRNVNLDWPAMQIHFRQQYSKFQSVVIQENSIFMFGDPFNLMKLQTL